MCNTSPKIALEIGTAAGQMTALMALNAQKAQIFTINIPPEEILSGSGGSLTTVAMEREKIGSYYRERNLKNISQLLVNSKDWIPNIGTIDVAFIDGCHDADYVFKDTQKVLAHCRPGSFILWHDFHPGLIRHHAWIRTVCLGIERLLNKGLLKGPIFHLKDSFVGLYQVT